jgi:Uma2 family endonuclease
MTIAVSTLPRMDIDTFLRWAERQEGRFELHRGRVVMMVNVSRNHSLVAGEIHFRLRLQLDPAGYHVAMPDFALRLAESVRFPDVLVEPAGGGGKSFGTSEALLLVEVLSPSSIEEDFVLKPEEYKALPSLQAYLIFSQDEPRAWVWERGPEGWPAKAVEVVGRTETVALNALGGVKLVLAEIYAGVRDAPDRSS